MHESSDESPDRYDDQCGPLFLACPGNEKTHLGLQWKGRTRFTVPLDSCARSVCWKVFRPGKSAIPLRAMALLPHTFGSEPCIEGPRIQSIRDALGCGREPSCCRAGADGPWHKDTLLFLDRDTAKPLYFVKTGTGAAVDELLRNEADWLRKLRSASELAGHLPKLVVHRPGQDFCFVVQRPLAGKLEFRMGKPQMDFIRKLQCCSRKTMRFENSRLFITLATRLAGLRGSLSNAWAKRLRNCMNKIEGSLSGQPVDLVIAHGDFTPWNIRVENQTARVFDWEYADEEQLPLMDALHFTLMPRAQRADSAESLLSMIDKTLKSCQQQLGNELCYAASAQALAYLMSVCALYLWSVRGTRHSDAVLDTYAVLLDQMCRR
jgi:hypothetical protein